MTKKQKRNLKKILAAGIIFAFLLILSHILPSAGVPAAISKNRWFWFILYLVPYLIVGWPVIRKFALSIKNRQLFDECFLMTLATAGAFITGENPEAVGVMLFYQVGEFFQDYAVNRSRRSIRELMDIAPESANRICEDGSVEEIDPDEIRPGDLLLIRPGDKIPTDGVVAEGEGEIDTSALTGESVPVAVFPGSEICSGSINSDNLLTLKATRCYEDSTVARILDLVENASSRKSKTESFITRFARYYTPIVVVAALALALVPPLFLGDFPTWIYRACTFLVISCPCALVISVPLSFFGGIGAASHAGILVKGSNYLELAAHPDTIATDKTGTLTAGSFSVTGLLPDEDVTEEQLLAAAAFAERTSTHPIAKSICRACDSSQNPVPDKTRYNEASVTATETVRGQGLHVVWHETDPGSADRAGEHRLLIGNDALMLANEIDFIPAEDPAATIVYVAQDSRFLGSILISDRTKPEAADAIRELRKEKVRQIVMLSGDRPEVCQAVGSKLGIDQIHSRLMPDDKLHIAEKLMDDPNRNGALLYLGDGINDAPLLTRADVGIAMGSLGSDAAIEAADIVIMDDNLSRLPLLIRIAKKTLRISTQNIVFALIVKILILVLGALGFANMWAAVFADVGVAMICILNAMRMLIRKKV